MKFELEGKQFSFTRMISMVLAVSLCLSLFAPAYGTAAEQTEESGDVISEEEIDFGSSNVYWGDVTGNATKVSAIAKKMSPGQGYDVSIRSDRAYESAYFTFTPRATGMYTFHSTGDTRGYLYDYCNPAEPDRLNSGRGSLASILTAGETYLYRVRLVDGTGSFRVYVTQQEMSGALKMGTTDVSASSEDALFYTFTPETSGTYYIYSTGACDTYGRLYDSDWRELSSSDDAIGLNFLLRSEMTAGTEYIVNAQVYNSGDFGIVISQTDPTLPVVEPKDISGSFQLGDNRVAVEEGNTSYYAFTPKVSGKYNIYSANTQDTYGYLYDDTWRQIAYDDDSGSGNNFRISQYLTAGTQYVVGVQFYDEDDSGDIIVRIAEKGDSTGAPLAVGRNSVVSDVTYPFVPEKSDRYVIRYLTGSGDIYVSSSNNEWSSFCDSLSVDLEAGETYQLQFSDFYGSTADFRIIGILPASEETRVYQLSELTEGENAIDMSYGLSYVFTPSESDYYQLTTGGMADFWVSGDFSEVTDEDTHEVRLEASSTCYYGFDESNVGYVWFNAGTQYLFSFYNKAAEQFPLQIERVPKDISSSCYNIYYDYQGYTAVYRGYDLSPWVDVYLGMDTSLEQDEDYTVSYRNNDRPGTATIVITGIGNYTGTVERQFTISKSTTTVEYDLFSTLMEQGETQELYLYSHDGISHVQSSDPAVVEVVKQDSQSGSGYTYLVKGLKPGTVELSISISDGEFYDYETSTLTVIVTEQGHQHSFGQGNTVAPTCVSVGYTQRECTGCGYVEYSDYQDYIDHDYQWVVTQEPTCGEVGMKEHRCTVCGYCDDWEELPAEGEHTFQWVVTQEPTCERWGYREYRCTKCDYCGDSEDIPTLPHNYVEMRRVDPDCGEEMDGYVWMECTVCGDGYEEYLPYSHDVQTREVTPTCTRDGGTEHYCATCGTVLHVDVSEKALGHEKGEVVGVEVFAPTCETIGFTSTKYLCKRCGETLVEESDYMDPLGHVYGEAEIVRQATCVRDGRAKSVCSVCGDVRFDTIPAVGHSYQFTDNGDGTHTGLCAVCNGSFTEAHVMRNGICSACGFSEKGSHSHELTSKVVPPSCEERGYTEHQCKSCDYSYLDSFTDAKGHTLGEGTLEKAASCTKKGRMIYCCTECGKPVAREEIPLLPHTWDEGMVTAEPGCETEGTRTYTCSVCNGTKTEAISAYGHLWNDGVETKIATCGKDGVRTRTCEKCKQTKEEPIPATNNHSWGEGVVTKEATYDAEGEKRFTCTVCGNTKTEKTAPLPKTAMNICTVTLSSDSFVYDGKQKTPAVTVHNGSEVLAEGTDYTLSYEKNQNAGVANAIVTGTGKYTGTVKKAFTISKAGNSITLPKTSYTCNASASKAQTISLGGKAAGGSVSYKSGNSKITVDSSGKVTIPKNFVGSVKITVSAVGNGNYNAAASKTVTIHVNQIANKITAANLTKTASSKNQSFKVNAKRNGSGKLSYTSSSKSVTVDSSGKITVKKNFVGKATITIQVAASGIYKAASKKITVTVNPAKPTLSSVKNSKSMTMTVGWKKNAAVTGYEIQYSTNKNFKSGNKTVTVKGAKNVSKSIANLAKGKTFYVRIRSYKTVSGKNLYSSWSAVKSVKIAR